MPLRDNGVPKLSIHAAASEARTGAHVRSCSDRTDYSHTERKLTKGRRATERAAYATLKISHDASEAEIKAQFRKLSESGAVPLVIMHHGNLSACLHTDFVSIHY